MEKADGEGGMFLEMGMTQLSPTPPAPGGSPILGSERSLARRPKSSSGSQRVVPESPGFESDNVPSIEGLSSLAQLELDEENDSESIPVVYEDETTTLIPPTLRKTTRWSTVPTLQRRRKQHHNEYCGTGPKQGDLLKGH